MRIAALVVGAAIFYCQNRRAFAILVLPCILVRSGFDKRKSTSILSSAESIIWNGNYQTIIEYGMDKVRIAVAEAMWYNSSNRRRN